jgi:C_GCAxxG_C_C family probable redox protein
MGVPSTSVNHFDQSAANWDNEPRRIELMKSIGEAILREVHPTQEMDVLDYGCGTGLVGLFLLPHVRSVTGADSSSGMLDVLRTKIAKGGVNGMTTKELDLEKQPIPQERFHMIVSSMVMHHVANLERVLLAFHEMLSPDGVLCIADLDAEPDVFHSAEAAVSVHHHGFDRSDFKERLEAAGFTNLTISTAHVVQKPIAGGEIRDFPVFLAVGRRCSNSIPEGPRENASHAQMETAVARFIGGFNCSQAVFSTYAGQFGLDDATALKIAAGFGGGMGRMGETCGAVTGAFMVLGLKYGDTSPNRQAKELIYAKIRKFADRFKARNGSLLCKDLLDCDISTPQGHEAAKAKKLFTTVCPKVVQDAIEILEEMLKD